MRVFVAALALALPLEGCSHKDSATPPPSPASAQPSAKTELQPPAFARGTDKAKPDVGGVKAMSTAEQEKLLAARLEGGMGLTFAQFANMFLVSSHLNLGVGVGLMTSDKEIVDAPLQSPFPSFYEPTLGEFLDAIALQTFSEWKYDPSGKYFKNETKDNTPTEGLAIFEFTKVKRDKPFAVTLPEGWTSTDKGRWLMLSPPNFPIGLDIYELGSYSGEPGKEPELLKKVRAKVALEWAQRVKPEAAAGNLTDSKVGRYDALFFEAMIPSQLDKEVRWRQWVFMVGQRCYFAVSTIFPEYEETIFPDVKKILESFQVK